MATADDILMRFVIKGMDPSEVKKLADQTYGALRAEATAHIDRLSQLHRAKMTDMADDAKKYNEEAIKATTKALGGIQQMMRAQEIAANQTRNAWRRTMEDLENVTTVLRGAFDVIAGGWGRFKGLAEDIDKTINVYGSLKGSIDEMREASNGEISDMDLILTKNRAMQKELELTDQQFGAVAAAADGFADSLGTNTKEAMDQLIDGLANGKTKLLQSVGVIVDADRAYVEYGDKIGIAVGKLTDHEKKLAIVEAGLRSLDHKLVESGGATTNFATSWEKTVAQISNVGDKIKLFLGDRIQDVIEAFTIYLPHAIKIGMARIKDMMPGQGDEHYEDQARAALGYELEADARAAEKRAADAKARLANPDSYTQKRDAVAEDAQRKKQFAASYAAEAAKRAAEAKKHADANHAFNQKYQDKLGLGPNGSDELNEDDALGNPFEFVGRNSASETTADDYVKAMEDANAADEKRAVMMARTAGLRQGLKDVAVNEAVAYQKLADVMGVEVEQLSHEEKMQAISLETSVQVEEAQKKAIATADALRASLKETEDKAGFLSIFLFGTQGPTETFKQMDEAMQYTVTTFGLMSDMLSGSAKKVTDAMAKNLTAVLTGNSASKVSIRQVTHDMLESLAQQSIARALFETGAGFASLALGPIGGASAAAHFAAAGMFAAVGVSAGLGARAVGNPGASAAASAGTSARAPSGVASSSQASFGSGGVRSQAGNSADSRPPVVINMNGITGPDAGREVKRAIEAYQQQTGEQLFAQAA